MHPNASLIENLYKSLDAGKSEEMAAAYHPDATFKDPVFDLSGSDIGDMWRMFLAPGSDLAVEVSGIEADDEAGKAHWEARYTYRPTGREVHNVVEAKFQFRDNLIVHHQDSFNLSRWARQALGGTGALLGWTGFVQNRIRAKASKQLARFQSRYKGRI